MVKVRKIASCLMLIMILFLPINSNKSVSVYGLESINFTGYGNDFEIIPDNNGNFFVVAKNGSTSKVFYIDSNKNVKALKFNSNNKLEETVAFSYTAADCVTGEDGKLYLCLANSYEDKETNANVFCYEVNGENLDLSLSYKVEKIESQKHFSAINEKNFFYKCVKENEENKYTIEEQTEDGAKTVVERENDINKIALDISRQNLYFSDSYNKLFCVKIDDLKNVIDVNLKMEEGEFKFLTDDILVSMDNKIYTLNEQKLKNSQKEIGVGKKVVLKCVTISFDNEHILAKTDDKIISYIACSDGQEKGTIELEENSNILAISKSGENIIAIIGENNTPQKIVFISKEDIKLKEENEGDSSQTPPEDETNGGGSTDTPSEDETNGGDLPENNEDLITSDEYIIDKDEQIISQILPGTTLVGFINTLELNGYDIVLKDAEGNVKKQSNIATGNTVTFVKDGEEKSTFKLIVKGDVTGTGKITTKTVSVFVDYLLGKTDLEDIFLQAGDINGKGEVSAMDLLFIYKELQK